MDFAAYADIWRVPAVRQALVLGALGKAPWFAAQMILTLHVVRRLGEPYSAAGLLTAVFTIAVGAASPWRGRLLDRVGLRRTLQPSLAVLPVAFVVAPFVPFAALVALMAVAGFFAVPWFVLTRQIVIAAVPVHQRRVALALDSVVTELAFMIGPALGILGAVYGDTRWTLPLFVLASVAAALVLWRRNPPLASEDAPESGAAPGPRPPWLTRKVAGLLGLTMVTLFILGGQDLAIVAAVRAMGADALLAIAVISWAFGSLIGGLLYGGFASTHLPPVWLTLGLALTTLPAALAPDPWSLSVLLLVTGLFCAPSLAAITEMVSHEVPEARRGEAMGWQGTFSTVGSAISPPLIGWVMDAHGWASGFTWTGLVGIAATALAALALAFGRRRASLVPGEAQAS